MTRESEAHLLTFCAVQHHDFHREAWLLQDGIPSAELATVALFLASVEWYGHHTQLRQLSQVLMGGEQLKLSEAVLEQRFDAPRFSQMLKRRLRHAHTTR